MPEAERPTCGVGNKTAGDLDAPGPGDGSRCEEAAAATLSQMFLELEARVPPARVLPDLMTRMRGALLILLAGEGREGKAEDVSKAAPAGNAE